MKFAATLLIASAAAIKLSEPEVDLEQLTPAEIEQGLDDLAAACEADPEVSGCDELAELAALEELAAVCEADPEASGCDELAELAELDTDEILELIFGSSSDSGSGSGSGSEEAGSGSEIDFDDEGAELAQVATTDSGATSGDDTSGDDAGDDSDDSDE